MNLEVSIFLFLITLSSITSLLVAYFMFKRRNSPGAFYYGLMEISCLFWNVGYIIEIIGLTLPEKMIGVKIQYFFGIPFTPLFWMFGALSFTSHGKKPNLKEIIGFSIVPFITAVLAILMESHNAFYQNTKLIQSGSFLLIQKDWGIWFYIHVVYSYLMNFIGAIVLFYSLKRESKLQKKQALLFLISISLPWLASLTYVTGMKTYSRLDYTNAAFSFGTAILGWSLFRYGLFDLIPAARDAVIESLKKGIIVLDPKCRIIDINPAAKKIFNTAPVIGEDVKYFLAANSFTQIEDCKESNKSFDVEYGDNFYEVTVSEVKTPDKGLSGKILMLSNVTERIKTEKKLSELNASKDKFFSIIAHDLRNPFFGIMGLSELLANPDENLSKEEETEIKDQIKEISVNTYKMLENLLDWSRAQTGRLEFFPVEFNIHKIIYSSFIQTDNSAKIKNINLINNCKGDLFVFADENMIATVIRNIISNAIKFTPEFGSITISTSKNENMALISVTDTGIGMDKVTLDNLFRIDKSTKGIGTAGERGTGLGLLLSKEFIEKNNGTIVVQSVLGQGSLFVFSVPLSNRNI